MLRTTIFVSLCLSALVLAVIGKPNCPPGKPLVNCFVNPCMVTSCQAFPQAECRANYCGGCKADFYVNNVKVNCSAVPVTQCPESEMVNCFVDPCNTATCSAYPNAVCHSNYCGGCNADFYVGSQKVTC